MANNEWICVGVAGDVFWPNKDTELDFDGHKITLRPETKDLMPSIAFEFGSKQMSYEDAMHLIQRFMSALSWVEGVGIRAQVWAGGGFPIAIGKNQNSRHVSPNFDQPYLPNPTDEKQKLALAIYRDALSLDNVAYKFLGLSRVLNIMGKSKEQKKWINDSLKQLRKPDALKVVSDLRSKGTTDIGHHIYHFGRSGVAHAEEDVVHPDLVIDIRRMHFELPLIKELAEIYIEKELKIKSGRTIYAEHLYELAGFKKALSSQLIQEVLMKNERQVAAKEVGLTFRIGLRNKNPYPALTELEVSDAQMTKGALQMVLISKDKISQIWLGLNFEEERLMFWPEEGVRNCDDGSKASMEKIVSLFEFQRDLFLNGALEVVDANSGKVLGYSDPFVPTNIDMGRTIANFQKIIEQLKKETLDRSK